MATKLYPPVIEGVLPAFCLEYDAVSGSILKGCNITIPFSSNAAVSNTEFKGFSLRIRTAASGSYIIPPVFSDDYTIIGTGGEVTFKLSSKQAAKFNEGQYYKIQIAYCVDKVADTQKNIAGTNIGYYSTVGVAKCTSKAQVSIKGLDSATINAFNNEFFGIYDLELCNDRTEKVYSYEFKIYDEEDNLYFTTGEKLHQGYYDTDYISSIDRITINDFASTDVIYSIQYIVTTLNGLVLSSPKYKISSQFLVAPSAHIEICPEADAEHGVIIIKFKGDEDPYHSYYYLLNSDMLNNLIVDENGKPLLDNSSQTAISKTQNTLELFSVQGKLEYLRTHTLYLHEIGGQTPLKYFVFLGNKLRNMRLVGNTYYLPEQVGNSSDEEIENDKENLLHITGFSCYTKVIAGKDLVSSMSFQEVQDSYVDLRYATILNTSIREKRYHGNFLLSRASDADNYSTWFNIARFKLDAQMPSEIVIRDVTIEHGRKYKYALQQYNVWGVYSSRIISDPFEASFEDAFLYDGEKSLRIRYNPTVDSFKTTILEQKTDTIGGKYPFITRNGATYYKEFPLGGLLAQEIDDWHQFVDPKIGESHRHTTQAVESGLRDTALLNPHDFSDTTIALERDFKLNVLDWLNNGKPKLFKSPYEGNYIVRLMNVSLSPVKELGRMLHSFTSQAYEIAECSYENLVNYGFIKTDIPTDILSLWKSYNLSDEQLINDDGDIVIEFESGGIENFTVQDMMPGNMIYLTFADNPDEELPIMIGITGSYTYENKSKVLTKIRIPTTELDHKLVGTINVFYEGMRITDFDAITGMQLKTIISQQYIGTSPWMEEMKKVINWDAQSQGVIYSNGVNEHQYDELQNYNFRTYLDSVVQPAGETSYTITPNFIRLIRTFDPGEILDRINLTINKGEKYKTELLNIEMLRFRERPIIPVYTAYNYVSSQHYIPGYHDDLLTEAKKRQGEIDLLVSTSPYGYPYPIEELSEYEMIDPFAVYLVLFYDQSVEEWTPITRQLSPYYDPYYRTWFRDDYDPTVKMNYTWVPVILLEKYDDMPSAALNDENLTYDSETNKLILNPECAEYKALDKTQWSTLIKDQDYLLMTANARKAYRENLMTQDDKQKKENGEFLDHAVNEDNIYECELQLDYIGTDPNYPDSSISHYYIMYNGQKYEIDDIKYDLYEKIGSDYFVLGNNLINHDVPKNKILWFKKYDVFLNLSTEKVVEYKNISPMNSYHIGNGVIAEVTFQIRVVDFYTETFDSDVAAAKAAYLEAKNFYTTLMKTYNTIARSEMEVKKNHAFMELYNRLITGKTTPMSQEDIDVILLTLSKEGTRQDLAFLNLYTVTSINTVLEEELLALLRKYKKSHENEDLLTAFGRIKVYQYKEESTTSDFNIYYVLDDPYDFNGGIEENADKVYHYKYTGISYFYKVKSSEHTNPNISDADNWVIVYNPVDKTYTRTTKEAVISDIQEIQELVEVTDLQLVTNTLTELNAEQKAALELDEDVLAVRFTANKDKLHEEQEILAIIDNENNQKISGVQDKLEAISVHSEETRTEIADNKAYIENMILNYTTNYLNMIDKVKSFNDLVYDDWCARVIVELLQVGYSKDEIKNIFVEAQTNVDTINVVDHFYDINRRLQSASNVFTIATEEQLSIQAILDAIEDLEDDEELDNILLTKASLTQGKILFKFLVVYMAYKESLEYMKSPDEGTYNTKDQISMLAEAKNEFNQLLDIIKAQDSNNKIKITYVNGLLIYLEELFTNYNRVFQSIMPGTNSISLEDLAILFNNYKDIEFALNNSFYNSPTTIIENYTIPISNSNTNEIFSLTNFDFNLNDLENQELKNKINNFKSRVNYAKTIGEFIDPFDRYSKTYSLIQALDDQQKSKFSSVFEYEKFYYRENDVDNSQLSPTNPNQNNNSTVVKIENPIPYFIFNPVGKIYDTNGTMANLIIQNSKSLYDILNLDNVENKQIAIQHFCTMHKNWLLDNIEHMYLINLNTNSIIPYTYIVKDLADPSDYSPFINRVLHKQIYFFNVGYYVLSNNRNIITKDDTDGTNIVGYTVLGPKDYEGALSTEIRTEEEVMFQIDVAFPNGEIFFDEEVVRTYDITVYKEDENNSDFLFNIVSTNNLFALKDLDPDSDQTQIENQYKLTIVTTNTNGFDSSELIYNRDKWGSYLSTEQSLILKLDKSLIDRLITMLTKIAGNSVNDQISFLQNKYFCNTTLNEDGSHNEKDYFYQRDMILNTIIDNGQIGEVGTVINRIENIKLSIRNLIKEKYPETSDDETIYLPADYVPKSYIKTEAVNIDNITLTGLEQSLPAYQIPFLIDTANNHQVNQYIKFENWVQDIYLNPTDLDLMTSIQENTDPAQLNEFGLYWYYISFYKNEKLPPLEALLEQEETLERLYETQLQNYTDKFAEFQEQYDFYRNLYISFYGTDAMEYYQALQSADGKTADALKQSYKANVQKAWWIFLNLLDARYKAEKERGMYV